MNFDELKNIIDCYGILSINSKLNKQHRHVHAELYEAVLKNTKFLPDNCSTYERLYCLQNGIKTITKCANPNCNKHTKFNLTTHYQKYCSRKCQMECIDEINANVRLKLPKNHFKRMRRN